MRLVRKLKESYKSHRAPIKYLKYVINKETKCWEVVSHKPDSKGYVCVYRNGKTIKAHRYSYKLFKGDIPEGMVILHKCDNRRCINPDHLDYGTIADNTYDMVSKKRHGYGETAGMSILTEKEVYEIRVSKLPLKMLSEQYDVTYEAIASIKAGRTWRHLEGDIIPSMYMWELHDESRYVRRIQNGKDNESKVKRIL
jgi:hypothetical protein